MRSRPAQGTIPAALSGKSDRALRESAGRYLAWLDKDADAAVLADMAWTAATGRSHFSHRAGVVFHDADSLRAGLTTVAEGDEQPARRTAAKVAFAYTGQASQWPGMGERRSTRASRWSARCSSAAMPCSRKDRAGASLLDVMFGRPGAGGGPGRSALEAAGDLRAGERAGRALGEHRHPA